MATQTTAVPKLTADRLYEFSRYLTGAEPGKQLENIYKSGGSEYDALSSIFAGGLGSMGQTLGLFNQGLGLNATEQDITGRRQDLSKLYHQYKTSLNRAPSNPQEAIQQRAQQTQQATQNQQQQFSQQHQQQQQQGEQAIKQLEGVIAAQPTQQQLANQISQELGLPGMRQQSQGVSEAIIKLQQSLYNLPQQVAGRTRGFDVNANRLAQIQEAEAQPLRNDMTNLGYVQSHLGQGLAGAESELGRRLDYAVDERNLNLMPAQQRIGLIEAQLAREATGFNQMMEGELQLLRDKLNSGERLMSDQLDRMHDLEGMERQYENSLGLQRDQQGFEQQFKAENPATTVIDTVNGQLLVNAATGTVIANLGMKPRTGAGTTTGSNAEAYLKNIFEKYFGGNGGGFNAPNATDANTGRSVYVGQPNGGGFNAPNATDANTGRPIYVGSQWDW